MYCVFLCFPSDLVYLTRLLFTATLSNTEGKQNPSFILCCFSIWSFFYEIWWEVQLTYWLIPIDAQPHLTKFPFQIVVHSYLSLPHILALYIIYPMKDIPTTVECSHSVSIVFLKSHLLAPSFSTIPNPIPISCHGDATTTHILILSCLSFQFRQMTEWVQVLSYPIPSIRKISLLCIVDWFNFASFIYLFF